MYSLSYCKGSLRICDNYEIGGLILTFGLGAPLGYNSTKATIHQMMTSTVKHTASYLVWGSSPADTIFHAKGSPYKELPLSSVGTILTIPVKYVMITATTTTMTTIFFIWSDNHCSPCIYAFADTNRVKKITDEVKRSKCVLYFLVTHPLRLFLIWVYSDC